MRNSVFESQSYFFKKIHIYVRQVANLLWCYGTFCMKNPWGATLTWFLQDIRRRWTMWGGITMWNVGDLRFRIALRIFYFLGFLKEAFKDLVGMYHWHELFCRILVSLYYICYDKIFFFFAYKQLLALILFFILCSLNLYAHPHMELTT